MAASREPLSPGAAALAARQRAPAVLANIAALDHTTPRVDANEAPVTSR